MDPLSLLVASLTVCVLALLAAGALVLLGF